MTDNELLNKIIFTYLAKKNEICPVCENTMRDLNHCSNHQCKFTLATRHTSPKISFFVEDVFVAYYKQFFLDNYQSMCKVCLSIEKHRISKMPAGCELTEKLTVEDIVEFGKNFTYSLVMM